MHVSIDTAMHIARLDFQFGRGGIEELCITFFSWRRYAFVILFIVELVHVHWELRGPHSPKNELRDGDEARWG